MPLRSLILLLLSALAAQAQVKIQSFTRGPDSTTLGWSGGYGPYLIETCRDLGAWSAQGDPAALAASPRTLAAAQPAARRFYRVRDLNPNNTFGPMFGHIQTDQGEFNSLFARHRLKTRLWLYKTKGVPHTSSSFTAANYFGKLIAVRQYLDAGRVRTWTGPLESLGAVTITDTNKALNIAWTDGSGAALRQFRLKMLFPYTITTNRTTTLPSDPGYELTCTYATPQPEYEGGTLTTSTQDLARFYEIAPPQGFPTARQYTVKQNGTQVQLHFQEGLPMLQGSPPFIFKTFILDKWLSPTTGSGGSLPAFSTDGYFTRTLKPGHHNFVETVLIEPGAEPSLSDTTRAAFAAANIRYIYTFKDLDIGSSPDSIRYIGFDNSVRNP